jgi:hypothetical protein
VKLYIDCEFNGGFGELISLALVAEDGREFYEVLPCDDPVPWVRDNVIPILHKHPINQAAFTTLLGQFLRGFESIELVADHPADVAYFCNAIIVDNMGSWLRAPPITASIARGVDYVSRIPHNALEDARAIRRTLHEE